MRGKVLIVGSQEATAMIRQELFDSFELITCKDKRGVLDLLKKERPFILIVSGCRMAREIREQIPEELSCRIRIITIINASTLEEVLEEDPDDQIVLETLIPISLLAIVRFQSVGKRKLTL